MELEKFLRDKKYGNIYFENSVNNNLIQIADLMIGAISYCQNDKSYRNIYSNEIAQKFVNTVKTKLNIDDLIKNNIVKIIDLTE